MNYDDLEGAMESFEDDYLEGHGVLRTNFFEADLLVYEQVLRAYAIEERCKPLRDGGIVFKIGPGFRNLTSHGLYESFDASKCIASNEDGLNAFWRMFDYVETQIKSDTWVLLTDSRRSREGYYAGRNTGSEHTKAKHHRTRQHCKNPSLRMAWATWFEKIERAQKARQERMQKLADSVPLSLYVQSEPDASKIHFDYMSKLDGGDIEERN